MAFPNLDIAETTKKDEKYVHKSFRLLREYNGEKIACTALSQIEELTRETTKRLRVAYGPFGVKIKGNSKLGKQMKGQQQVVRASVSVHKIVSHCWFD